MNEISLLRATHLVAARALRNNPMEVSLLVCDGYDPREVVRMKMEQERLSASNFSATIDSSSLSSEGNMMISCVIPAILYMYTFTCTPTCYCTQANLCVHYFEMRCVSFFLHSSLPPTLYLFSFFISMVSFSITR